MGELCLHDVRTIQVLDPWITPSTGAVLRRIIITSRVHDYVHDTCVERTFMLKCFGCGEDDIPIILEGTCDA